MPVKSKGKAIDTTRALPFPYNMLTCLFLLPRVPPPASFPDTLPDCVPCILAPRGGTFLELACLVTNSVNPLGVTNNGSDTFCQIFKPYKYLM